MPGKKDFTLTMGLEGAATIVTGLNQLVQLVSVVTSKIQELARQAHEYGQVIQGHTVSVREADEATAHLIPTIELHRAAARLEAAGIEITASQFRDLAVAAGDYARRTGTEVTQSFEDLTRAVIGCEAEGLRRYGIVLEAGGTQAQRQGRVLGELTERFADQRLEIEDTHEAIQALQNSWTTAWSEMVLALESEIPFISATIQQITEWLNDLTAALETQRRAQAGLRISAILDEQAALQARREAARLTLEAGGMSPETAARYSGRQIAELEEVLRARRLSAAGPGGLRRVAIAGGRDLSPEMAAALAEYRATSEQIAALEESIREIEAEREAAREEELPPEAAAPRAGRGGRGRRELDPWTISEQMATLSEDVDRRLAEQAARGAESVRSDLEVWDKRREAMAAFFSDLDARQEESAAAFERAEDAKRRSVEATTLAMEAQSKAAERAVQTFQSISDVTQALGGVMDQVSGILTAAAGEDEKTVERMKKVRGAFLIAEAVVQAALEAARAAASFAEQDYSGGAMHVIAAAMYAAAAVKAGVEMGASSKTGTGGAGSRAYPERRGGERGGRSEPQPVVVNINGPVTSRRVNEDVEEMRRGSSRYYS